MYKLLKNRFEHQVGTIVYDCKFYDYGLCRDDEETTGVPHAKVTLNSDGSYPFFTIPVDNLEVIKE